MMARRRIGQEQLNVGIEQAQRATSLDEMAILIDWAEVDGLLVGIYAAARGELGWPPLALWPTVDFSQSDVEGQLAAGSAFTITNVRMTRWTGEHPHNVWQACAPASQALA